MWELLSGKKTHIMTALGALTTIFGFTSGVGIVGLLPVLLDFVTSPAMQDLLTFGAISGARAGIAKI